MSPVRVPVDKKIMVQWQKDMMEYISTYKVMYDNIRIDNPAYLSVKDIYFHLTADLADVQEKIRTGYYDIQSSKTIEPSGL